MASFTKTATQLQGPQLIMPFAFMFKDVGTVAIGSIATVLTPTTGLRYRLIGGEISVSAAASVLFEDNSAATANFIFRTPALVIATPYSFNLGRGFLSAATNNVLKATSSAGANLVGTLFYTEEQ